MIAIADPTTEPGARRAAPVYTITLEGAGPGFACAADEAVLIAMEKRAPKQIPVGCRGGGCGYCRVLVLGGEYRLGKMSRERVTVDDESRGFALACRLYPKSDLRLRLAGQVPGAVAKS